MQDIDKSETGTVPRNFKLKIFDMWKFTKVENIIPYPQYEVSYTNNTVYLSSNIELDRLKKVTLNAVKDICMINYGGGRENPFIEWLNANVEFIIDTNL